MRFSVSEKFFLLLDALIFSFCFYFSVEATLLWKETVFTFQEALARWGLSFLPLFFLASISPLPPPGQTRLNYKYIIAAFVPILFIAWSFQAFSFIAFATIALALIVAMLFFLPGWPLPDFLKKSLYEVVLLGITTILLPAVLLTQKPLVEKGEGASISFLWLPLEWHKLNDNIKLLLLSFPFFSLLIIALHLFCFFTIYKKKRSRSIALFYLFIFFILAARVTFMEESQRKQFFWAVFGMPYIAMATAAFFGQIKLFARTSVVATGFTVLWGFYTALVPFDFGAPVVLPSGVTVLYPEGSHKKKAFPTEYMRDVFVDSKEKYLFTCYGPTSGLVRLNLKNKSVLLLPTKGLLRHFWTTEETPYLYTTDWIYDDLWVIHKENFDLEKKIFLWDKVLIAPIDIEVSLDSIFIASTELPALTRFSRKTFQKTGQLNLRALGLTSFKSGAWEIARDPVQGKIFLHLGMVNKKDEFLVLKVDEKSLRIEKVLRLKSGGLTMISVPQKRSLLLGDFYSSFLYEIDMEKLKVRREMKGALNMRSLAYDSQRDLIYTASFLSGNFLVLRYKDGKIIKKVFLGKKPSQFFLSEKKDALYFGSSLGVMKIDLKKFFEES